MICWRAIIRFFLLAYSCATPGHVIINDGDIECASGYYKPSYNFIGICIPCPQGETSSSDNIPDYCKKYLLGVYHNKKRLALDHNLDIDPDLGGGDSTDSVDGTDGVEDIRALPSIIMNSYPAGSYKDKLMASYLKCDKGYYYDSTKNSCIECPPGTYSVGGEQGQCVDCLPTTYNNKKGQSECLLCGKGEYSFTGASICEPCHSVCSECFGPSPNQCVSCKYIENDIFGNCTCNNGSYYDSTTMECSPCHSFCAACFGPSYEECIGCNYESAYPVEGMPNSCEPRSYTIAGYYFDGISFKGNLYPN